MYVVCLYVYTYIHTFFFLGPQFDIQEAAKGGHPLGGSGWTCLKIRMERLFCVVPAGGPGAEGPNRMAEGGPNVIETGWGWDFNVENALQR